MNFVRSLKTFLFILRRRPARAWEELQIRLERKLGISLYFLSLRRWATYLFEKSRTSPVSSDLRSYGNYFLDPQLVPEEPVVFSLGVGQDISFDRALLERHKPKLFLFDPTPASRRFIDEQNLPVNVSFDAVAVSDRDGDVAIFTDDLEHEFDQTSSVSIFKRGFYENSTLIRGKRITTLMREKGVSHLDILKMDIEGAAIQVLEDILREGICPDQLACEFERPERISEVFSYLKRLSRLFDQMRGLGYELYRTRPLDKGCQVEILAVRRQKARLGRR